jgi:hypothetical protein
MSTPHPSSRSAHLYYDGEARDNITSYPRLFADVIDGRLPRYRG